MEQKETCLQCQPRSKNFNVLQIYFFVDIVGIMEDNVSIFTFENFFYPTKWLRNFNFEIKIRRSKLKLIALIIHYRILQCKLEYFMYVQLIFYSFNWSISICKKKKKKNAKFIKIWILKEDFKKLFQILGFFSMKAYVINKETCKFHI